MKHPLDSPRKIRVGILCGGKSAEHEISLQSAVTILEALDKEKFEPVLIGIDKSGKWHLNNISTFLLQAQTVSPLQLDISSQSVALLTGEQQNQLINTTTTQPVSGLDVIFPVLHGPLGEDGTIQGLLRLANLPFVGAGVLGSAIGMDKDVMKRLLREAGLPIARFLVYRESERKEITYLTVSQELGLPFFIKPANMGSSVGVSKITDQASFEEALQSAFKFDTKILLEEAIEGVEVECSILGNDRPIASLPGKIVPRHEFYSYHAKYVDENGALLEIPADLSPETITNVQRIAIQVFQTLACEGMARVDCFVTPQGKVIVNEINTIPGFTKVSMYPKLWEASGLSYTELITRLIELAFERYERQQKIQTSYT